MANSKTKSPVMVPKKTIESSSIIRNIYLYLVAIVGLTTFVIGAVGMIDNVLQDYVFNVGIDSYSYANICTQPHVDFSDPSNRTTIAPSTQEVADCLIAQKEQARENQHNLTARELSISTAEIIIGLPLWLSHWFIIQSDQRRKKIV